MTAIRRRPKPQQGSADIAGAARLVFADYEDLLHRFPELDAEQLKAFAARHVAGRAALAHFEHLLKLAGGGAESGQQQEVAALRDAARAGMAAGASEEAAADADRTA
jgi:hypothetical protein